MRDIAEIRKLSVPERLQIVGEIWDSILDAPELLPMSDELARELQARLEAHRASPTSSESWESVDEKVFGLDCGEGAPDPEVEEAWAIEAERRWSEIESGEVGTIPWEEVRAKLYRRG